MHTIAAASGRQAEEDLSQTKMTHAPLVRAPPGVIILDIGKAGTPMEHLRTGTGITVSMRRFSTPAVVSVVPTFVVRCLPRP